MAIKHRISMSLCLILHASAARIKNIADGKPCDFADVNFKKYGKLVKTDSRKFWDSCQPVGATCPVGCLPYSDALGLTFAQRSTKAIGHSVTGSCEKVCRYTDETMMATAEDGGAFAATSAAVLEAKLALQKISCGNFFSQMVSATCAARQRKIASLFSFLVRNLFKASSFARAGEVGKCNAMLPTEIRPQLSASFSQMVESMISTGQVPATEIEFLRRLGRTPALPNLCETLQDMGSAESSHPNATASVKIALQQASGGRLSQEEVDRTLATLGNVDAQAIVEQALVEDERQIEAALVDTDGNGTSLVQADAKGFIVGIFAAFWSLLAHGILGTIMGVWTSAMCLISFGEWTRGLTKRQLEGIKLSAWMITCPVRCFSVMWGFVDDDQNFDPFKNWGLDWKNVKRAFRSDD